MRGRHVPLDGQRLIEHARLLVHRQLPHDYTNNVPIPLIPAGQARGMAGKGNDASPEVITLEKAWKKAGKLTAQNKAEQALSLLREVDAEGAHQTTLRLAGKATHAIAQHTTSRSEYRKAASLLRDAVKMDPKDKTARKALDDVLNDMLEKRIRLRSFRKVGYVFAGLAMLLLVIGTLGITLGPATREAPASPPSFTQGTVFFGPEPLRGNPAPLLLSAEATVTWDRSDLFLVIADAEKKEECDAIPPLERIFSSSETCRAGDPEYEMVGDNGTTGLTWTASDGEYYVGIGTMGESNPDGAAFDLNISVKLRLSASGYALALLMGAFGARLIKVD